MFSFRASGRKNLSVLAWGCDMSRLELVPSPVLLQNLGQRREDVQACVFFGMHGSYAAWDVWIYNDIYIMIYKCPVASGRLFIFVTLRVQKRHHGEAKSKKRSHPSHCGLDGLSVPY